MTHSMPEEVNSLKGVKHAAVVYEIVCIYNYNFHSGAGEKKENNMEMTSLNFDAIEALVLNSCPVLVVRKLSTKKKEKYLICE